MPRILLCLMIATSLMFPACEGPEGPKGDKGDTGDCSNCPANQPAALLELIKQVDGAGSGLDADTLDGTELSALLDEINALKARVQELEAQKEEVLYAFDGGGQLLGRVLDVRLDSIVYYDRVFKLPVEVFLFNVRGEADGQHVPVWYFIGEDCTVESHRLPVDDSSEHLAVLDQHTGGIYMSNGSFLNPTRSSSQRRFNDGTCEIVSTDLEWTDAYQQEHTIDSFQPGVYVAPLE